MSIPFSPTPSSHKKHKKSLKISQKLSKSPFLVSKIKHFAKKIEQKMSIESPAEIFITRYTEKIQNEKVRNYYLKDLKNQLWKLERQKKNQKGIASFSNAQSISKPTAGLAEGRMLLAYLICYPQVAQNIIENLADIQIQEKQTQALLTQIIDLLIQNPDISSEEIKNILAEQNESFLPPEIEMLQKSGRTEPEVIRELDKWIQTMRLQSLNNEKVEKLKEFAQNPTSELWEEITLLKQEIEKLASVE